MKKKVVLLVAIALIAVTACILLVGCAPSNPTDFMDKWLKSDKKSYSDGRMVMSLNGNIVWGEDKEGNIQIVEEIGKNVNLYYGIKGEDGKLTWEAQTGSLNSILLGGADPNATLASWFNKYHNEDAIDLTKEDFEKNFEKEDGWYVGSGLLFDGIGIKITAKEMLIKYDMKEEKEFDAKYTIGCEKYEIPQEAKDALKK